MDNRNNRSDAEEGAANKTGGVLNQVKGKVKEAWGDITDNPSVQREGARDRVKGRIQEEYGDLKRKESEIERDLSDIDSGRL